MRSQKVQAFGNVRLLILLVLVSMPLQLLGQDLGAYGRMVQRQSYPFEFDHKFKDIQCVFENTLAIGNSISAEVPHRFLEWTRRGDQWGESPAKILSRVFNKGPSTYRNEAVGVGALPSGKDFIDMILYEGLADQSDTIIGTDLFYMSTIFNDCHFHNMRGEIRRLVQFAVDNQKTLVLGTVPQDKFEEFGFLADLFVLHVPRSDCRRYEKQVYYNCIERQLEISKCDSQNNCRVPTIGDAEFACLPYAQQKRIDCVDNKFEAIEQCRQNINNSLREECTSEKNCYLADLEKVVDQLHRQEPFRLSLKQRYNLSGPEMTNEERVRDYYFDDLRPDKANISPAGTHVIIEDILHNIQEAAIQPKCIND